MLGSEKIYLSPIVRLVYKKYQFEMNYLNDVICNEGRIWEKMWGEVGRFLREVQPSSLPVNKE